MAFSETVKDQAFRRSEGRCECTRSAHSHSGRCTKTLTRGSAEFHHRSAQAVGGHDGLPNSEVLCAACHQQTASYGRRSSGLFYLSSTRSSAASSASRGRRSGSSPAAPRARVSLFGCDEGGSPRETASAHLVATRGGSDADLHRTRPQPQAPRLAGVARRRNVGAGAVPPDPDGLARLVHRLGDADVLAVVEAMNGARFVLEEVTT
jgi:hypothetical protein